MSCIYFKDHEVSFLNEALFLWSPRPPLSPSSSVTSRCYKQQLSGLYPLGVNGLLLPVLLILELYLLNIFDCPHIFFLNLWDIKRKGLSKLYSDDLLLTLSARKA